MDKCKAFMIKKLNEFLKQHDEHLFLISYFCLKLPKKHIDQFNVAVHAKSNEFASANGIKEN
ncbi:hypothetical protein T09_6832 [Trichinella sp. T9]|nr:hypothetical protein T09_6832 [Trichinella sp. T9]